MGFRGKKANTPRPNAYLLPENVLEYASLRYPISMILAVNEKSIKKERFFLAESNFLQLFFAPIRQ